MLSFWVYILRCADGTYYTGHTDNMEKRLYEHRHKITGGYTSSRLPVKLVYVCEFGSREEALASEMQIKGWSRKKKEALMAGDWDKLVSYSRNRVRPSTGSG